MEYNFMDYNLMKTSEIKGHAIYLFIQLHICTYLKLKGQKKYI